MRIAQAWRRAGREEDGAVRRLPDGRYLERLAPGDETGLDGGRYLLRDDAGHADRVDGRCTLPPAPVGRAE